MKMTAGVSHGEDDCGVVIVIGAGVLGLSAAVTLQTAFPRMKIAIFASEIPGEPGPSADYASAWAGAHYRPTPGDTPQLIQEAQLARKTAEMMKRIAAETPESGVALTPAVELLGEPTEAHLTLRTGDPYAWPGDGFRLLEPHELAPGMSWGCKYQAYCVNVPVYCSWLLQTFLARGGQVLKCQLSCAHDAFEMAKGRGLGEVSTIINCSGRNFDLDPATDIVRGQTVLVKNPYHSTVTMQLRDGGWAFLIPRPLQGGTIVGGTKEHGDWEADPRDETTRRVLATAADMFPDFVKSADEFEVVKVNVGRRPWRRGGLRLEVETCRNGRRIIHGYGAGGRGYELSWGVAQTLLDLFQSSSSEEAIHEGTAQ